MTPNAVLKAYLAHRYSAHLSDQIYHGSDQASEYNLVTKAAIHWPNYYIHSAIDLP